MLPAVCFCILWFLCMLCFIICGSETNGINRSRGVTGQGTILDQNRVLETLFRYCDLNVV